RAKQRHQCSGIRDRNGCFEHKKNVGTKAAAIEPRLLTPQLYLINCRREKSMARMATSGFMTTCCEGNMYA
ncbi:MAG: hypothetical protein VB853_13840, partial [Pirellulales bacterium]